MHSKGNVIESQGEASAANATEVPTTNYKKMTVKQLVQEIKSRNLPVTGISKLKKEQLIDVLKNSE